MRTYLDRGVGLMISSDQQPVGPIFHIFEAVNRVRRSGKPILPEEAITVEEAIRATTITPACNRVDMAMPLRKARHRYFAARAAFAGRGTSVTKATFLKPAALRLPITAITAP